MVYFWDNSVSCKIKVEIHFHEISVALTVHVEKILFSYCIVWHICQNLEEHKWEELRLEFHLGFVDEICLSCCGRLLQESNWRWGISFVSHFESSVYHGGNVLETKWDATGCVASTVRKQGEKDLSRQLPSLYALWDPSLGMALFLLRAVSPTSRKVI